MVRSRAVVVAILAAASLGGWWLGRADRGSSVNGVVEGATAAVVVDAVDGDTLHVRIGARADVVRLLGIDTPETHHPRKPVQCFGPEAAAYTQARLAGRRVLLEPDVEARDKYGRMLAYVIVGGSRFNDELLTRGYARLLVIPPNGAHARTMLAEELAARRHRTGLWGACEGG